LEHGIVPAGASVVQGAGIDVENQAPLRRAAEVIGIDRPVVRHLDVAGAAFGFREFAPFPQAFLQQVAHGGRILANIFVGEQFAAGAQTIDSLAGVAAFAFARSLVRHADEEFSFRILPASLVPIVRGNSDVVLAGDADDVGVGEGERTARHTVVSGAAKRMPVHFPKQNGFAHGGSAGAGFPQAGEPRDAGPFLLERLWFDEGVELLVLPGRNWLRRASGKCRQ